MYVSCKLYKVVYISKINGSLSYQSILPFSILLVAVRVCFTLNWYLSSLTHICFLCVITPPPRFISLPMKQCKWVWINSQQHIKYIAIYFKWMWYNILLIPRTSQYQNVCNIIDKQTQINGKCNEKSFVYWLSANQK